MKRTHATLLTVAAAALLAALPARAGIFDFDLRDPDRQAAARLLLLGPEGHVYYNYPWGAPYGGAGYPFGPYLGFQYPWSSFDLVPDRPMPLYYHVPLHRPFNRTQRHSPIDRLSGERHGRWTPQPLYLRPRSDPAIGHPDYNVFRTWDPMRSGESFIDTERRRRMEGRWER